MIHPINIPDDLLAEQPGKERFFARHAQRRRHIAGYGADGRRFSAGGVPLEPISADAHWQKVFLRSFIRQLAVGGNSTAAGHEEEEEQNSHVDIVDLSAGEDHAIVAAELGTTGLLHSSLVQSLDLAHLSPSEEKDEENSEDSPEATTDRPPEAAMDEEVAEGDALVLLGCAGVVPRWCGGEQRVSRRAIRSILQRCCPNGTACRGAEFARFDFSHAHLGAPEGPQRVLELLPEQFGRRLWTRRGVRGVRHKMGCAENGEWQHPEAVAEANGELKTHCAFFPIRFQVSSVRIQSAQQIQIGMKGHCDGEFGAESALQITTHAHIADSGQRIGECLCVSEQNVPLGKRKDVTFVIRVQLDAAMREKLSGNKQKSPFLLVTVHGKLSG